MLYRSILLWVLVAILSSLTSCEQNVAPEQMEHMRATPPSCNFVVGDPVASCDDGICAVSFMVQCDDPSVRTVYVHVEDLDAGVCTIGDPIQVDTEAVQLFALPEYVTKRFALMGYIPISGFSTANEWFSAEIIRYHVPPDAEEPNDEIVSTSTSPDDICHTEDGQLDTALCVANTLVKAAGKIITSYSTLVPGLVCAGTLGLIGEYTAIGAIAGATAEGVGILPGATAGFGYGMLQYGSIMEFTCGLTLINVRQAIAESMMESLPDWAPPEYQDEARIVAEAADWGWTLFSLYKSTGAVPKTSQKMFWEYKIEAKQGGHVAREWLQRRWDAFLDALEAHALVMEQIMILTHTDKVLDAAIIFSSKDEQKIDCDWTSDQELCTKSRYIMYIHATNDPSPGVGGGSGNSSDNNDSEDSGNDDGSDDDEDDNCQHHAYYECYHNDIFWFDSCGNREDRRQECPEGCTSGAQACDECDGETVQCVDSQNYAICTRHIDDDRYVSVVLPCDGACSNPSSHGAACDGLGSTTPSTPSDGDERPPGEIRFNWLNVSGAHHYEFELTRDPTRQNNDGSFSSTVCTQEVEGSLHTSKCTLSTGIYYWHVRAVASDGHTAPWSVIYQIIVR